jgi:hypothetical protein
MLDVPFCTLTAMIDRNANSFLGEPLITLAEATKDFGGVEIPLRTVRKYIYEGVQGLKLESININGRYTSKEAIQRFIERKQNPGQPEKPRKPRMSQAEIDAGLRRHGIIR